MDKISDVPSSPAYHDANGDYPSELSALDANPIWSSIQQSKHGTTGGNCG